MYICLNHCEDKTIYYDVTPLARICILINKLANKVMLLVQMVIYGENICNCT